MSTTAKWFVAAAAILAMAMVDVGTAHAVSTVGIGNYNFQDDYDSDIPDGQYVNYPLAGSTGYIDGYYGTEPDQWFMAQGHTWPFYAGEWNPTSAAFTTAGGNGVLPGTAAGSQCLTNAWTSDQPVEVQDSMYIAGTTPGYHQVTPWTTMQPNLRYTLTMAIGSAKNATLNNGNTMIFVDTTVGGLACQHDDMLPNGLTKGWSGTFVGWGSFGDISYSISSTELKALGVAYGDGLTVGMNTGAGTCWSNVRLVTQNWNPLYTSAAAFSGNVTWNGTATCWSLTSGSGYTSGGALGCGPGRRF